MAASRGSDWDGLEFDDGGESVATIEVAILEDRRARHEREEGAADSDSSSDGGTPVPGPHDGPLAALRGRSPGLSPVHPRQSGGRHSNAGPNAQIWRSVADSIDDVRQQLVAGIQEPTSPTRRTSPSKDSRSSRSSSSGGDAKRPSGGVADSSRSWVERNDTLRKLKDQGKLNERGERKVLQDRAAKEAFEQGSSYVKDACARHGERKAFQLQLFLKDVPLFRTLSELERFQIVSKCHAVERDDRATFVEQGQKLIDRDLAHTDAEYGGQMQRTSDGGLVPACAYLYVIEEGTVELEPPSAHQNELSKKDLFGELGLLAPDYTVHPTTVRAKGYCRALRIPFDALKPLMRKHDAMKPTIEAATVNWRQAGSLSKFKQMVKDKCITPEEFVMLQEGWRASQRRAEEEKDKIQAEMKKFRYGEIEFAETGRTIPYLIIPNTEEGRDPMNIVVNMIRHFKSVDGKQLAKPSITFRVRAGGVSYLEWAEEVYANDFLAERWGWKRAWERGCGPKEASTDGLVADLQRLTTAELERRRDAAREVAAGGDPTAMDPQQDTASRFGTIDQASGIATHVSSTERSRHSVGAAADFSRKVSSSVSFVGGHANNGAGVGRHEQVPVEGTMAGSQLVKSSRGRYQILGDDWTCQICMRVNDQRAFECETCGRKRGRTPSLRKFKSADGGTPRSRQAIGPANEKTAYTPQKQRRNRLYAALSAYDTEDAKRQEIIDEIVVLELKQHEKQTDLKRKQWQGFAADETKWGRHIYSTREVDEDSIWVDKERLASEEAELEKKPAHGGRKKPIRGGLNDAQRRDDGGLKLNAQLPEMVQMETVVERDDAIRDFGDKILRLFKDVVQGIVNADGWFITAAGRMPPHQLIGDTIDTYGGDLEKIVWLNYNNLQNPFLIKRYKPEQLDEETRGWAEKHARLWKQLTLEEVIEKAQEYGILPADGPERLEKLSMLKGAIAGKSGIVGVAELLIGADKTLDRKLKDSLIKQIIDRKTKQVYHSKFVDELRECSKPVDQHSEETPTVKPITYPSEEVDEEPVYPTLSQIQGGGVRLGDIGGEHGWLDKKMAKIGEEDIVLHPRMTHLLLWDDDGKFGIHPPGEQYLPWQEVDKLHKYLKQEQGIAEGALVCNGNMTDITFAMDMVKKSCPVVSVKSIGGASEKMSQFFDDRMYIDPQKKPGEGPNRPRGYADRYPARAIDPIFHEVLFTLPKEGMLDSQLISLDAVDPNVGQAAQKQMAELLTYQQIEEERQLGFRAAEKARLSKAWHLAVLYGTNATNAKVQSDILNYLLHVLSFITVLVVVLKSSLYPEDDDDAETLRACKNLEDRRQLTSTATSGLLGGPWAEANGYDSLQTSSVDAAGFVASLHSEADITRRALQEEAGTTTVVDEHATQIEAVMSLMVVVLPMVSGVLLTINNAFTPMQKCAALRWANAKMESHIYQYRSRSLQKTASAEWHFGLGGSRGAKLQLQSTGTNEGIAKTFMNRVKEVSEKVQGETQIQNSSLAWNVKQPHKVWKDGQPKAGQRVSDKQEFDPATMTYSDGLKTDMKNYGFPRKFNHVPSADELNRFEDYLDDGFCILSGDVYAIVRTQPLLQKAQKHLEPLASRKEKLQAAIYFVTAGSVMLGALHLDLYVAVTTALAGFLGSLVEYHRLEDTVVCLNNTTKTLQHLLGWWDSLSFVERRMNKHKDQLVRETEKAALAEWVQFYPSGADAFEVNPKLSAEAGEDKTKS